MDKRWQQLFPDLPQVQSIATPCSSNALKYPAVHIARTTVAIAYWLYDLRLSCFNLGTRDCNTTDSFCELLIKPHWHGVGQIVVFEY